MGGRQQRLELHWAVPAPELPPAAVRRTLERSLARGGWRGERVDVVFVCDDALAELHAEFLADPTPTDVIAFDLGGHPGDERAEGPAAEIYVSVDCARRMAARRGVSVARELALYLVHGALHLCGFDDHDSSERAHMRRVESELLAQLGHPPDDAPHELSD